MTGAATQGRGSRSLAEEVEDFTRSQSHRGIQAVALEVGDHGGQHVVSGTVLTPRQARDVVELARRHGASTDLLVAADPNSGREAGWLQAAVPVLDLWREPSRSGEEMGRQTQYLASEGPLRWFGEVGGFVLVQGADLAMGWAAAADVTEVELPPTSAHPWAHVWRAEENGECDPAIPGASAAALLAAARGELDVPYTWGGTTHAGFDCSGLLQRVFAESTGVLLPRHTGDQRRVGARVIAGDVRPGDLLFARPINQKIGHVLLMSSATTVVHACRTEQRVIEEPLDENARRYQHQGWRRPVALAPVRLP